MRDQLKAGNSNQHQAHCQNDGKPDDPLTAPVSLFGIGIAEEWNNTGLQPRERDKEKGLDFVVQAQNSYRLIGETGKDQIKHHDVYGVERLHQDGWIAQMINALDVKARLPPDGRSAQRGDGDQRCEHLSGDRGIGSACNPKCRKWAKAENQERIKHDVGQGACNLRSHRKAHVSPRLMHLSPCSFKEYADAADADNIAVCQGFPGDPC